MRLETRKLLVDASDACDAVAQHLSGLDLAAFVSSRLIRHAVQREFEIIGEALNRLSKTDPETAARISELPKIVGFRNRIVHGYDTVDDEAVWAVSQSHLKVLQQELKTLLNEAEPPNRR